MLVGFGVRIANVLVVFKNRGAVGSDIRINRNGVIRPGLVDSLLK